MLRFAVYIFSLIITFMMFLLQMGSVSMLAISISSAVYAILNCLVQALRHDDLCFVAPIIIALSTAISIFEPSKYMAILFCTGPIAELIYQYRANNCGDDCTTEFNDKVSKNTTLDLISLLGVVLVGIIWATDAWKYTSLIVFLCILFAGMYIYARDFGLHISIPFKKTTLTKNEEQQALFGINDEDI